MEKYQEVERSLITKFRSKIWRLFIRSVDTYKMIEQNDKIAVCISGGKDSFLLAKLLQELKIHGEVPFELEFIAMDPGYNSANRELIISNAKLLNIPIHIFTSDIFDVTVKLDKNPCYMCARMRRGTLYQKALELGCNKIALGHHFDDVIETILMGMLYGAQVQTMMPKVISKNFENMELIRPLYLVKEQNIIAWKNYHDLTFLNCACKVTKKYALEEKGSKRHEIKELINNLRKVYKDVDINIFRSVEDINLNTIIGYHNDDTCYNFLDDYEKRKTNKTNK